VSAVQPFPWQRLPRLERAAIEARRELCRRVASSVDPERLSAALSQLLGADVELSGVDVAEQRSAELDGPSMYDAHTLAFPAFGWRVTLWPEPDLARACVARLLGQGFELGWADAGIDAALRGASAALALELARRAARTEAPELISDAAPAAPWSSVGHATLRLGGKPYRLELRAETLALGRPAPAARSAGALARLGDAPIAVPWLAAVSLSTVTELEGLAVGDVWVPGAEAWLGGGEPLASGVLCAPRAGRGWPIRVSGGKIVVGAEAVRVHEELNGMSQEESELTEIVGETPVLVRLELGALEMSAAEWAALRPGDVVQCGRRIEDPIVLRAGGREIARGELVDIEGEVGIRITRVGSSPR
jgi:type III secretion protein Q